MPSKNKHSIPSGPGPSWHCTSPERARSGIGGCGLSQASKVRGAQPLREGARLLVQARKLGGEDRWDGEGAYQSQERYGARVMGGSEVWR